MYNNQFHCFAGAYYCSLSPYDRIILPTLEDLPLNVPTLEVVLLPKGDIARYEVVHDGHSDILAQDALVAVAAEVFGKQCIRRLVEVLHNKQLDDNFNFAHYIVPRAFSSTYEVKRSDTAQT